MWQTYVCLDGIATVSTPWGKKTVHPGAGELIEVCQEGILLALDKAKVSVPLLVGSDNLTYELHQKLFDNFVKVLPDINAKLVSKSYYVARTPGEAKLVSANADQKERDGIVVATKLAILGVVDSLAPVLENDDLANQQEVANLLKEAEKRAEQRVRRELEDKERKQKLVAEQAELEKARADAGAKVAKWTEYLENIYGSSAMDFHGFLNNHKCDYFATCQLMIDIANLLSEPVFPSAFAELIMFNFGPAGHARPHDTTHRGTCVASTANMKTARKNFIKALKNPKMWPHLTAIFSVHLLTGNFAVFLTPSMIHERKSVQTDFGEFLCLIVTNNKMLGSYTMTYKLFKDVTAVEYAQYFGTAFQALWRKI